MIISSSSKTTAGVWIGSLKPCTIEAIDSPELGAAVLRCLEASRQAVPHPGREDFKAILAPLLAAANVRTWTAFLASARLVEIATVGNRVELIPSRNRGPKEGFEAILGKAIDVAPVGAEVSAALLRAFRECE